MMVQGHFQPPALGKEPDLTAGEPDRIDINIRIGLDPRHACTDAEALRRDGGRSREECRRHDNHHDDVAPVSGAYISHPDTPRPNTTAACRPREAGAIEVLSGRATRNVRAAVTEAALRGAYSMFHSRRIAASSAWLIAFLKRAPGRPLTRRSQ